ncbi:MAG: RND family transporter [Dehalococcoidales bacterium]|nr:MAG: RND family transporter [Dehalococcoidales bacterium]
MKRFSEALARLIERRPWWFVITAVVLIGAAVPGVTMLDSSTGFEALVSPNAKISQDNARYEEQFGADTIIVLLNGPVDGILSGENLMVLHDFEQEFSQDDRYRSVLSPLTLLQTAIYEANQAWQTLQEQIATAQEQAAAEARRLVAEMGLGEEQQELAAQQAREEVLKEFQPYIEQLQQMGEPALDNTLFVAAVLYDSEGAISEAMLPFVPDDEHVMIVITPQGNMPDDEALQAAQDIEDFFTAHPMEQVEVTVIADSKLINAISNSLGQNIAILFGLSVVAMVLILLLMFRVRWRLLPLLIVGTGTLWTFGMMGYASVPMTMTTMAVLPILIGLGIDYSIQFQNRYQEEVVRSRSVSEAIITSLSRMFPVVSIALVATLIGFITLYISEVPMIRDFGMMLAVGIILSYIAGLFLLNSIVYLSDRRIPIERLSRTALKASSRIERVLSQIARLAVKYPLPVFLIALVFAIAGGVVDQWLPTNTDYEQLMPQDIPELAQLRELRQISGSGGEIRFMVEADNAASPEVLDWIQGYQAEGLAAYPELISANSPVTLIAQATGGVIPGEEEISQILENTPPHYVEQVISGDRTMASLSFTTRYLSLEEINDLLESMLADARPPANVKISPVGTIALGASTVDAVVGTRFTMNLLCLGAVFIVLLLVYRRLSNAIFIILPVGAVIAWSSLDMYLIGIPLNPLTAVLGVIIIGICTEFMVLLMGRYDEEKREGQLPQDAMVTALSKIGRAIVTTALTTLGGFGVLIASDFVMIRDFGIATVLGVFLCLVATITVMPGIIVWYDRWRMKRVSYN